MIEADEWPAQSEWRKLRTGTWDPRSRTRRRKGAKRESQKGLSEAFGVKQPEWPESGESLSGIEGVPLQAHGGCWMVEEEDAQEDWARVGLGGIGLVATQGGGPERRSSGEGARRASDVRIMVTDSVKRSFRQEEEVMSGWQVGAARVPLDALIVSDEKQTSRPWAGGFVGRWSRSKGRESDRVRVRDRETERQKRLWAGVQLTETHSVGYRVGPMHACRGNSAFLNHTGQPTGSPLCGLLFSCVPSKHPIALGRARKQAVTWCVLSLHLRWAKQSSF